MKPGDIRVFKGGKRRALSIAVGIWAKERRPGGPIDIHITGTPRFHTTVSDQPDSQRFHRTLFRDLKRVLESHNRWPESSS